MNSLTRTMNTISCTRHNFRSKSIVSCAHSRPMPNAPPSESTFQASDPSAARIKSKASSEWTPSRASCLSRGASSGPVRGISSSKIKKPSRTLFGSTDRSQRVKRSTLSWRHWVQHPMTKIPITPPQRMLSPYRYQNPPLNHALNQQSWYTSPKWLLLLYKNHGQNPNPNTTGMIFCSRMFPKLKPFVPSRSGCSRNSIRLGGSCELKGTKTPPPSK